MHDCKSRIGRLQKVSLLFEQGGRGGTSKEAVEPESLEECSVSFPPCKP